MYPGGCQADPANPGQDSGPIAASEPEANAGLSGRTSGGRIVAKPVYVVRFSEPDPMKAVDRVRNFAEDVCRSLCDEGLGSVPNMDTAIDEVRIEVASKRHVGRVEQIIGRHLRHHRCSTALVECSY